MDSNCWCEHTASWLRLAFHVCVSASREVILVHFSVTISMNVFPLAGTLPVRRNATRWATLPRACCPYWCNMHGHNLELVKTIKMPSNDQVNSIIPQTCFRMHGNPFFLLRKCVLKRASGNTYMESWPLRGSLQILTAYVRGTRTTQMGTRGGPDEKE